MCGEGRPFTGAATVAKSDSNHTHRLRSSSSSFEQLLISADCPLIWLEYYSRGAVSCSSLPSRSIFPPPISYSYFACGWRWASLSRLSDILSPRSLFYIPFLLSGSLSCSLRLWPLRCNSPLQRKCPVSTRLPSASSHRMLTRTVFRIA